MTHHCRGELVVVVGTVYYRGGGEGGRGVGSSDCGVHFVSGVGGSDNGGVGNDDSNFVVVNLTPLHFLLVGHYCP